MLNNIFGIASNSGILIAFRLGVFLIFTSLASFLAIRLAMSLVSTSRVKKRKQWDVEPALGDSEKLIARLLCGRKEEPVSQSLLNSELQRMLAQPSKIRR